MAVRYCHGEDVRVYEISGTDLADLLQEAADLMKEDEEGAWIHGMSFHHSLDEHGVVHLTILVA